MNLKLYIFFLLFFSVLIGKSCYESAFTILVVSSVALVIYKKSKYKSQLSFAHLKKWKFVFYLLNLIVDIFKSSIQVINIILFTKKESDNFITTADISNDIEKTIFMNSITITPGTLSIKSEKNKIFIHSIANSMLIETEKNKKMVNELFNE